LSVRTGPRHLPGVFGPPALLLAGSPALLLACSRTAGFASRFCRLPFAHATWTR